MEVAYAAFTINQHKFYTVLRTMKEIPDAPFYRLAGTSNNLNEFLESYSVYKKLSIASDETLKEFLSKKTEKEYRQLGLNISKQAYSLLNDTPELTFRVGSVYFLHSTYIGKNPLVVEALHCVHQLVGGLLMFHCGGHPEMIHQFRNLLATIVEITDNYILPYIDSES